MPTLVNPAPKGWRSQPYGGSHRGIDYGYYNANEEATDDVHAAADGVVESVYDGPGDNGGWGRRVVIDHGYGIKTTYNHFEPGGIHVRVGQHVSTGQYIGEMGASGRATGKHLHFELLVNGTRVDPQPYYSEPLPNIPTTSGTPASSGGTAEKLDFGSENWFWYRNAADAEVHRNPQGSGGRMLTGSYRIFEISRGGAFRVRSVQNGDVWVSPKAATKRSGVAVPSQPAPPAVAPKVAHVRITEPWFVYNTEHEAYHALNKRGTVPAADYLITDYGNNGKPVQISAPGQEGVRHAGRYWIGSAKTAAPVVWL